jgi:hypothetical protein
MASQLLPNLNDIEPSWADIAVVSTLYEGPLLDMTDINAINWSRSLDLGERKAGGRVMARTQGDQKQEASWTLYQGGYIRLLRALKDIAIQKGFARGNQALVSLVGFDVQIDYTPKGSSEIFRVKIKGCRLTGDSSSASDGPDASTVELTLNPIEVVNIIDGVEVALV